MWLSSSSYSASFVREMVNEKVQMSALIKPESREKRCPRSRMRFEKVKSWQARELIGKNEIEFFAGQRPSVLPKFRNNSR
jgi:hypothetical protein